MRLSRVGTLALDLLAVVLSVGAVGLAYLMLRRVITHFFYDPRGVLTPRTALSVFAVIAMVVVAPIATNVHWRTSARAGVWVSASAAVLGDPPVDPVKFRAWWWGRLAASAWIVGFLAILALTTW